MQGLNQVIMSLDQFKIYLSQQK